MIRYNDPYAGNPAPRQKHSQSPFILWVWAGKYWFQILVIGFMAHLFLNREVSLRVNMQEAEKKSKPAKLDETTPARVDYFGFSQWFSGSRKEETSAEAGEENLEKARKYVERFAKVALAESEKFGIPASIILAQSIWGSQAGNAVWAREFNNHFGFGCPSKGACKRIAEGPEYQVFESAWLSFRANSQLLTRHPDFKPLFKLKKTDYKGWAKGLQQAGYQPHDTYALELVEIIEKLDLDLFDKK